MPPKRCPLHLQGIADIDVSHMIRDLWDMIQMMDEQANAVLQESLEMLWDDIRSWFDR